MDNFSKFGWKVLLKNKSAQRVKDSFENILIGSKGKPKLIDSDKGKEFYNSTFQNSLNNNNVKVYSRNTSPGAVFAERFYRTMRDLLKRLVFERGNANWIDVLPTITKQNNNRAHTSTKMTPFQASLEKNERYVYKKLLDKRKKLKIKLQVIDLIRTADLKKNFFKRRYD